MTIPKRIFYVWGVNDPKKRDVQVCIQTWRQYMPDYEIIEINEASVQYFDFQKELKENKWFRAVYERKMWAYVADYVRIKVLYENGGVYFDTDVSVVKPMDKFLNERAFVGIQCSGKDNYTEPAILGAEKGNSFLCNVLDFYNQKIWEEPIYTMPQIFEYYLQKKHNVFSFPPKDMQEIIRLSDITLYPERYFIPFEYGQSFTPECVEADTHTIHWFGGSWVKPEILNWLMNKHKPECRDSYVAVKEENKTYRVKLFGFIPLLKIKCGAAIKCYLFSLVPLFCYKKQKLRLFGVLPICKVKIKKRC